ncbi:uncharacterized protein TNCV_309491 [Trichonephila clavipes]|nr:uncharacterized protein TNCV_309491 [Trichonephila clavipes]
MHFGKRSIDEPWHNKMSFGKKSENPWNEHNTMHFGKRDDDPWHNMMSFGKKAENPFSEHSTMHFGKRDDDPWHSMMSFGKRGENPFSDHSTMHFGKRDDEPWHNMMSFGKKSENTWENHNTLHFGKKADIQSEQNLGIIEHASDSDENIDQVANKEKPNQKLLQNSESDIKHIKKRSIDSFESETDAVQSYAPNKNNKQSLQFRKKDDSWNSHNTMHFGKKSMWWKSPNSMYFGKKFDPWNTHNTMHFGKKSDYWDTHNTMHFGKRSESWDSQKAVQDVINNMKLKTDINKNEPESESEKNGKEPPVQFSSAYKEEMQTSVMEKRSVNELSRKSYTNRNSKQGSDSDIKIKKQQGKILKLKQRNKRSLKATDFGNQNVNKRILNVKKTKMFNSPFSKAHNKRKTSNKMDKDDPKTSTKENRREIHLSKRSIEKISFEKDNQNQGEDSKEEPSTAIILRLVKNSVELDDGENKNFDIPPMDKRFENPWDNHNTMHFGKKSDPWEWHTMHFGKKFDPWELHNTMHFGKRSDSWDSHNTMHFGKRSDPWESHTLHFGKKFDPWEPHNTLYFGKKSYPWELHNTMHFGKKSDPWESHNTLHFGKRSDPWESHNTLHFGKKRDPWENHSTLHFGKREDREAENSDNVLDSSKEDVSYSNKKFNSRGTAKKLNSKMKDLEVLVPLPSYWKESNLKNFEKGLESFEDLKSLEDNSEIGITKNMEPTLFDLTFPESKVSEALKILDDMHQNEVDSGKQDEMFSVRQPSQILTDNFNIPLNADKKLLAIGLQDSNFSKVKQKIKKAGIKRYWAPFQGPKSIVYPHAWLASQIRRSVIPKSIDKTRIYETRMAEKKEDPVNSFMHFGRR